jgi:hypothetical protein
MGGSKKLSFLFRIVFQVLVLKYMFKTESSELVFSTTIIVFVNYLNLILDLGLSLDQLSINYGIRRLILGVKYVFLITILIIIPVSIFFSLPLYVSSFIAISALFRNYYMKKQFVDLLFFLDFYGTIITLLIVLSVKYFFYYHLEYHYLVFLPSIIEFFLLIPIFLKLLFSKLHFRLAFSPQNYISKIIDISINNTDTLLVTLIFDNNISKNYIQVKTVFVKCCQISNLFILRVLFDKIEMMMISNYTKNIFLCACITGVIEITIFKSIYLTSCILSFILSLVSSYLIKHSTLKHYNIYSVILYFLFYIIIYLLHISPSLLFIVTTAAIIATQLYGTRKI